MCLNITLNLHHGPVDPSAVHWLDINSSASNLKLACLLFFFFPHVQPLLVAVEPLSKVRQSRGEWRAHHHGCHPDYWGTVQKALAPGCWHSGSRSFKEPLPDMELSDRR